MKIISHADKGINGSQNRHTRRTINRPASQKLRQSMTIKVCRSFQREGQDHQPLPPKVRRAALGRWGGRVSKRMAPPPHIRVVHHAAPRQPRRHVTSGNSGAGSGSGSGDDGGDGSGDGEPPHQSPLLLDYEDLSRLLKVAVGTLKNRYSQAPNTLPPAILIPGHRGPLWMLTTVLGWLESHEHPAPVTPSPKRRVGRPRLAMQGKRGVS